MRTLALSACAAALLAGCAVLTIDVDVYKGPLINNERIRGEQVAAMAIGARPLLLQLRSDFEARCWQRDFDGKRKPRPGKDEKCIDVDDPQGLADACIGELGTPGRIDEQCLLSWRARRVNAVLDLYENLSDDQSPNALSVGRRHKGVDTLIREYFAAEAAVPIRAEAAGSPEARQVADRAREHLLAVLLDFGQKVAYLANFELLLPESEWFQSVPFIGGPSSIENNARLLQAVGNSILTQVHDKKHWDEYRVSQHRMAPWRLEAQRKAEASVDEGALAALRREIETDAMVTQDERNAALAGVAGGKQSRDEVAVVLAKLKAGAGKEWRGAEERAAKLAGAKAGLGVRELAERFASANNGGFKLSEESAKIVRELLRDTGVVRLVEANASAAAVKHLDESLDEIADKAPSLEGGATPDQAYEVLRTSAASLSAQADKKAAEAKDLYLKRARWAEGIAAASPVQSTFPYPVGDDKLRDANEVLDRVIAGLQQQHVLETRSGLDARAKSTAAALQLAEQYRTDGIFVRHSAVFLRDSYPATVLQRSQEDSNLLFNRAINFGGTRTESSHINNTVDKQFWQTVNHISLSAAGNITYVLAKDDVGNWYVKGYSAKPDEIYKSAAGLALYAASSRLPGDFLANSVSEQAGLQKTATTPGEQASLATGSVERMRPVLDRQVDLASIAYATDLRNGLANARDIAKGARDSLIAAGTQAVSAPAKERVAPLVKEVQQRTLAGGDDEVKTMDPAKALHAILAIGNDLLWYRKAIEERVDAYENELGEGETRKLRYALREASSLVLRKVLASADKATAALDSKLAFVDQSFPTAAQASDAR
jgi:hypothetical protein